jgi:hypothetical protein
MAGNIHISLKDLYITTSHLPEKMKPETLKFNNTIPTINVYTALHIFEFLSVQRDVNHKNLSAELLGKYRILWLQWSQLVSQIGLCLQYISVTTQ